MTTLDYQKKIISLLSEVKRSGIDNLIKFIQDSDYLTTAQCYSHHKCPHGLMMHSLEVLDSILQDNLADIPRESLILTALCHDLGKATINGRYVGRGHHPARSIAILDKCGLKLTNEEREAILCHHPKGIYEKLMALSKPLQLLLHRGDCVSTGVNKRGEKYIYGVL